MPILSPRVYTSKTTRDDKDGWQEKCLQRKKDSDPSHRQAMDGKKVSVVKLIFNPWLINSSFRHKRLSNGVLLPTMRVHMKMPKK
jgi:hypothetical protein